jgi:hypothetical protein
MKMFRVLLATMALAITLAVTPAPAADAASARCKVGAVHCVRPVPWLCRWPLIAHLFPAYCARVLI